MTRPSPESAAALPTLRLASYNIRKAVGLDWRRDPARTLRVIRELDADVIALQEADKRLSPRHAALHPNLIERETDLRLVELDHSPVSIGWHGNAVLVRAGLEVIDVSLVDLPGIEPRGSVAVRLKTALGELAVVGVHLGLRRGCRAAQLETILGTLPSDVLPRTVIMGDFNEWSERRGLDILSRHFDVVRPGRTYHSARPVACLDRFALGSGLSLMGTGVVADRDTRVASDHLPVWAEVSLAGTAGGDEHRGG